MRIENSDYRNEIQFIKSVEIRWFGIQLTPIGLHGADTVSAALESGAAPSENGNRYQAPAHQGPFLPLLRG